MAIKSDLHLHSNFSGDSDTPMEEMVQKAISLGLTHICFTEHYDPDYLYTEEEPGKYEINTDSYLYDLLKCKAKYQDQIKVLFGIELGLQPQIKRELAIYNRSYDFDFVIGSTHICNRKDPYYPSFFEGRSEDEAHQEYFEAVLESVKKLSYFSKVSTVSPLLRNKSEMHHTPARAITVYTIRLRIAVWPPKIHATMSNLNKPMQPQLSAPIMVSTSAVLSSICFNSFAASQILFATAFELFILIFHLNKSLTAEQ